MSATLIDRSQSAAAPFGQKAGVIARFLGWIRQSRHAHCVSTLDPRLATDAGLSARFAWRTEHLMIDRAVVLATEAGRDRRTARQMLELDHPGVLADFQHAAAANPARSPRSSRLRNLMTRLVSPRPTRHGRINKTRCPKGVPSLRNVFAVLVVVAVIAFGFWAYVGSTDTTANGLQSMNDRNFDGPIPQLPPVL